MSEAAFLMLDRRILGRFAWLGPYIRFALSVFWTLSALFLVVIAILVFQEQTESSAQRHKEATTTRVACERAQVFGPPFIEHLERVEAILHTGSLDQTVLFHGKPVKVLAYYRQTIPKSCPSR